MPGGLAVISVGVLAASAAPALVMRRRYGRRAGGRFAAGAMLAMLAQQSLVGGAGAPADGSLSPGGGGELRRGTSANPLRAHLCRRTSVGAAVWHRPDGIVHGRHGSFRCCGHASGREAGGPVGRSAAAGWDASLASTFPSDRRGVTFRAAPSRRGEVIGWAGFLLFVAIVFRLRRSLDRR